MRTVQTIALGISLAIASAASGQVKHQLRLWGLDADDGQLFAIDDVSRPKGTFRDFGPVIGSVDGRQRPIGDGTGGFTVIHNRFAYMAINRGGGTDLLTLDLRELNPGMPVIAETVGPITFEQPAGERAPDVRRVVGIAAGHLFDAVYVLVGDDDPSTPDELFSIDDLFGKHAGEGVAARRIGPITLGDDAVLSGGDISIGPGGNVLITDDAGSRVVVVDPASGAIVGVRTPLARSDGGSTSAGGLAWDAVNDRIALFNAASRQMTVTGSGEPIDIDLGALGVTDAEGLSFVLAQEDVSEHAGGGGFSNITNPYRSDRVGSPRGARAGGGGGGGGGGGDPLADLFPDSETPVEDIDVAQMDPPAPGTGGTGPDGDDRPIVLGDPDGDPTPEGDPNDFTVLVPAPAGGILLIASLVALGKRRRGPAFA